MRQDYDGEQAQILEGSKGSYAEITRKAKTQEQ